ncbi:MAG: BON domain-containing protein [Ferruginibacter sp.]
MNLTKFTIAAAMLFTVAFSGCKPKDADIQTSVQSKQMTGVTVAVKDGVATLTGEVADEAAKMKAEEMAKAEKGVKSVMNNLTVMAATMPAPVVVTADDPLSNSVRDAVKDHPTVTATVADGVVTLTGSVKKADLPKLMMNLQSLKPKRIESTQLIKN